MKFSRELFRVTTKTIVATGIGAALFAVLFMFVKIPSGIPNTEFQTAPAVSAFFGAIFGPITSGLMAFIGHALSDSLLYGSPWWSWVVANGVASFIFGFAFNKTNAELGELNAKGIITFNLIQLIGNVVAWVMVAPLLDIVIYAEPVNLAFTQGVTGAILNTISCGVLGTLLLFIYSETRTKKGSLSKE